VKTENPGEIVALDVLELTKNKRILLGIDYFSRKLFGMKIKSKAAKNTIKLLEQILKEITINKLVMDNGR
jgi:hypothetical protein